MTLADTLIPTYRQMLTALPAWLDKAQDQGDALMAARLAPDMFPLATQVRFACVQALEGVHRLRGEAFPAILTELLDEGRQAGERPGSIADAKVRIAQTLAMVGESATAMPPLDPAAPIVHDLPNGMIFDLTAEQYVRDWAIPQFYFHVMTAYAILRAQGVALGKGDYVTHMFAHLRPGTMPG